MTAGETFGPVARERAEAREVLRAICEKLEAGSATSADHRPALEAVMVLPMDEAEHWLEQIRAAFVEVYAHERRQHFSAGDRRPVDDVE